MNSVHVRYDSNTLCCYECTMDTVLWGCPFYPMWFTSHKFINNDNREKKIQQQEEKLITASIRSQFHITVQEVAQN